MYETFDHTADVGLRVSAPTLEELFADAARGLMAQFVEDPAALGEDVEVSFEVRAEELEDLFFDWLCELLYRFDSNRLIANRFHIEIGEGWLRATVRGGEFDPDRHEGVGEIKAITYHGLRVEEAPGGYVAEVILDV